MNEPEEDDGPPPKCIPLWVQQSVALLKVMESDVAELLPMHGKPGRHRQRIILACRELRYHIEQLETLGE